MSHRRRSLSRLGGLIVGVLSLVGLSCGSDISVASSGGSDDGGRGIDGTWVLDTLTEDGTVVVLPDGLELRIDADRIWGDSACNSFSGSVDVQDNGSFAASDLSQTEMACVDRDRMALDSVHPRIVAGATSWSTDGLATAPSGLTLTGPGGSARYSRAVPPADLPLAATVWALDTVYSGTGPAASASSTDQSAPPATVEIGDGAFTLRSGSCETIANVAHDDGNSGSFTTTALEPQAACGPNYDAAAEALVAATSFAITESRLTLRADDRDLISFLGQ